MNDHLRNALRRKLAAAEAAGDKKRAKLFRARLDESEAAQADDGAEEEVEGYGSWSKDELQAEADGRGLTVEGSGQGGGVLKADLAAALEADDAKESD